jgi:hypothetical protein
MATHDAVKIFMPAGAKKPVYAPYVEHVPPDVTAAIFWLKNRDPETLYADDGRELVARFSQIEGYRCLSLMRAFLVVKCQSDLV